VFSYLIVTGAPGLFFFSAWLLMIFAGILSDDIGVEPFGYVTSMVATIGLWLVVAPLTVAAARRTRRR
jgi:hypothetical protein